MFCLTAKAEWKSAVMILRVWAMYNRSRLILVLLLMIFVPYIVLTTIVTVIINIPKNVKRKSASYDAPFQS